VRFLQISRGLVLFDGIAGSAERRRVFLHAHRALVEMAPAVPVPTAS
jgi:hypothetical protein